MLKKWTSAVLALAFLGLSTMPLQAAMVSTDELISTQQAQMDRESIAALLDRADVQEKLVAMGVTVGDVEQRIALMTNAEVAQLNQQIADLPAGEGVVGILVLLFVIFVVTDVIGATNIFPFIRPVR
ncbi:MAG: PA2779 family protein [Thiomicrospira sp.]|uniref:DUF6627 family protein n=1 Tax=Thiomicrospira sp. TaxID=935 RepID=UPI001A0E33F3|nr:DUF6627 family protein [Thiomicrospira sp.]MBE0493074.1 PA2779 family protein [Thiomicrospira sp.]